MKIRKSYILILTLLMMLCNSCIKRPEGVQSDKKMAPVIADLELAEAYMETQRGSTNEKERRATVDRIIEKHGLTREQFDTTMAWYGRNNDNYYELCTLVEKELSKRKHDLSGDKSIEIETSDLWPYPRLSLLSRLSSSDAFNFSIPTVDVQSGQQVEFRLRINRNIDATAMLGVEYDNGAKGYMTRKVSNSRRLKLIYQTDTAQKVTRIFGNILMRDNAVMPLWIDSIYLSTLPFDSMEYYKIHNQREYRDPVQRRRLAERIINNIDSVPNKAESAAHRNVPGRVPDSENMGGSRTIDKKVLQPMRKN